MAAKSTWSEPFIAISDTDSFQGDWDAMLQIIKI
jgi:hypothetical protein